MDILLNTKYNNIIGLEDCKIKAFTLAEILITLGIIGIIAAMTVPTLVKNSQEIAYKTAAKKAYSISYQAINEMKRDEGGTLSYYTTTNNTFKPVFMKYFKVIEDCGWSDCVPGVYASDIYKSLSGDPANTAYGAEGQFTTADGFFFNIQNLGAVHPEETVAIMIDVNGYKTPPNTLGVDTFAFQILNDNLVPMGAPGTSYTAPNYCQRSSANARQGIACMTYVMQDIKY